MDSQNPADMSNQDLENDMQGSGDATKGNQEKVNKSTAAEGTLISPDEDQSSKTNIQSQFKDDTEQDPDDLVHSGAEDKSQDGSMPDPETLDNWESNEDDDNKISG